jgi:hypothetical protein
MKARNEFSVVIWYPDDTHEYVCRFVGAQEAVETARRMTQTVGARHGMVSRVMITDGGDCTNFLWEHGKGLVYPTREELTRKEEGDGQDR